MRGGRVATWKANLLAPHRPLPAAGRGAVRGDLMTFDLIVRGATLPDGRRGIDIAAQDGRIAAIEPAIAPRRASSSRPKGGWSRRRCRQPFHMDATLSLGLPRLNQSGTLLEGIALWGELKPLLTHEAVIERALRYCDLAVARVCWRALARRRLRRPAAGGRGAYRGEEEGRAVPRSAARRVSAGRLFRSPTAAANLKRALDLGST